MAESTNVQGAADKIAGILEPKGQPQKTSEEPKAEPSENPVEQEVQNSQAQSEATEEQISENTETEETTTELQEEPNLHRLKVNGQEIEVSLDELKAGYSRDSDYRQKTHTLGLEKRDLENQKNSLRQTYDTRLSELNELITTADSYVRQQSGSKDLQRMYEEDPTAAAKLDFQLRKQSDQINEMKTKAQMAQQQQYSDYLDAQRELAAQKIPEYSDPSKADKFKIGMRNTLRTYGFNDQEIGTLADHRFLMVAKDAMNYQSLKDKKNVVQKKVANAPKVIKAGTSSSRAQSGREGIRNKINRLSKTGHLKDAQSAIMDMINLKSQQRK